MTDQPKLSPTLGRLKELLGGDDVPSVEVPRGLLLEAISHIHALADLAHELHADALLDTAETDGLRDALVALLPDAPKADDEDDVWNTNPVHVATWSRASEIEGTFLSRLAGGESWLFQGRPAAAFLRHAAEIREAGSIDVGFPGVALVAS